MTKDLEIINSTLIKEADDILYKLGLMNVLGKFGNPHVSGSYLLKMMTWRDLDIYLESNTIKEEDFFELGKELSIRLKPSRMNYRNELLGKTPNLPNGLYWGVYTNLFQQHWKIDIWAIDSKEYQNKRSESQKLSEMIDSAKRKTILQLKSQLDHHPKYRRDLYSVIISCCYERQHRVTQSI